MSLPTKDHHGAPDGFDHELSVAADHPALTGHFPGRPVVPGVVLLDLLVAALQAHTGRRVVRLRGVKFSAPLRPAEPARVRMHLEQGRWRFSIRALREPADAAIASGIIEVEEENSSSGWCSGPTRPNGAAHGSST